MNIYDDDGWLRRGEFQAGTVPEYHDAQDLNIVAGVVVEYVKETSGTIQAEVVVSVSLQRQIVEESTSSDPWRCTCNLQGSLTESLFQKNEDASPERC